jgi:4-amino-4-deoxy-L-arabinose transferase-like glycosyltransferase
VGRGVGEGSSRRSSPGGARGQHVGATFALFFVALLPRLYIAIAWAREPVWDGHYYDFGARRIAAGLGYSDDVSTAAGLVWHPWCHYPVGYSGFLGLAYAVFGSSVLVATLANALVGGATAAATHRLALQFLSPARSAFAALLVALSPGLVVYTALLMTEPLAGFLVIVAAWLAARDRTTRPLRGAALAGLVLGLATLVRPQSLLVAPALALLIPWPEAVSTASALRRAGGWLRRALPVALLASAAALAVVAPWTARNCRVMDGCALVSTNGGWNLAIGSFPRATGRFETLRGSDGCSEVTGQVQQDRCWFGAGIAWIREDPTRWLGLVPKKLAYTFDHESFPIGYVAEAEPAAWPEERRALGRRVLTVSHGLLLFLAALGVVARPRLGKGLGAWLQPLLFTTILFLGYRATQVDEHRLWPLAIAVFLFGALPWPGRPEGRGVVAFLALFVGSVALTHAVFFGEDRYHVVLVPALALLAGAALRVPGYDVTSMPHLELVRKDKVSSFRKLAIGAWRVSYDPTVYGTMTIRMEKAVEYIAQFRQKTGRRITVTHLVTKAVAEALRRCPDANALLRFNKIYLRKHVNVSVLVLQTDGGEGKVDLTAAKIADCDQKSLVDIADELDRAVKKARSREDKALEQGKNVVQMIPFLLMNWFLRMTALLMYTLNIDPQLFGMPRDAFGSVTITNVGSLGLDVAYVPLVPYTHVPIFIAPGEVRDVPVVEDGLVIAGKVMNVSASFDHRFIDGYHAGVLAKTLRSMLEDPFGSFDDLEKL